MSLLRNAAQNLAHGRFTGISKGFYAKETALSRELLRFAEIEGTIQKPADFRFDVVAEKLKIGIARQSASELSSRDWRVVPWLLWRKDQFARNDWLLEELFDYATFKHSRSVIRALINAYISFFSEDDHSFKRVGRFVFQWLSDDVSRFGEKWLAIHALCELFFAESVGKSVSRAILSSTNIKDGFDALGITGELLDGGLASLSFRYAYESVSRDLFTWNGTRNLEPVFRILESWCTGENQRFRYTRLLTPMAVTVLESLDGSSAPFDFQERIVRFFVRQLGDPRIQRAHWFGVSDKAKHVAIRLLIRGTLEDFTRVIDATADAKHWQERKPFWLKYYESGAIEDAWVAFGPQATSRAVHLENPHARLNNASDTAHSALIVRMQNLIIVEWSHNGRCRFFPLQSGRWTPSLYEPSYDFRELHRHANDSGDYLSHMSNWQFKFAARIYEGTNIRHPVYGSGRSWM